MGHDGPRSKHSGPFQGGQYARFPARHSQACCLLRPTNVLDFPATRLRIDAGISTHCLFNLVRRPHTHSFFVTTSLVFVVMVGVLGYDVFRYYQYKLENPRPSEAVTAYEETSLLPLKDYQRKRILTFLAPKVEDPGGVDANWNRIQALIAVSTGGITGKGLGDGMQAKLGYLPPAVAHNDFIFAVLAEESGTMGCLVALGAFFLVIFGCLKVAAKSSDRFGGMLAVGVSVLLMTHAFINVGMTIGITPITGLPLPFLSYGGSFLVTCFVMLGMVQSVYRHRREFR